MKRQTIVVLTAIIALLAATMLAGCVEKEVAQAPPIDNKAFKNMCADAFEATAVQIDLLKESIDNNDFERAKSDLVTFETVINTNSNNIEQTRVSVDAIPSKKQVLAFFDNMKLSVAPCRNYLETQDEDEWMLFLDHLSKAMINGSIAVQLAEDL